MTELQLQRFTRHFNFGNNRQSSSIAHGYIIGTVTFDGVKGTLVHRTWSKPELIPHGATFETVVLDQDWIITPHA